jgi:hypothetical protein
MALGAAGYLLVAAAFLLQALWRDGVVAWLTVVAAGCFLWLGGTLAATVVWRRSNPCPS